MKLAIWLLSIAFVAMGEKISMWCPPPNFVENRIKFPSTVKTALISEVHGQLVRTGDNWGIFHDGNLLSRNMYHHIGSLGFDKLYLHVLYNDSIHLTPPTIEEIYPHNESCVKDWFETGVLVWKPLIYANKDKSKWERHPRHNNELSKFKNLYKTLRGINPTYASIRNITDWVLVLDIDEYLFPVNFKPEPVDWCKNANPRLITKGLKEMTETATYTDLQTFRIINESRYHPQPKKKPCKFGSSRTTERDICSPILAFIFPVYFWTYTWDADHYFTLPAKRSIYPSKDAYIMTSNIEQGYQVQDWKSIHQTKLTPYLEGMMSMHYGSPHPWGKSILSPRSYHSSGLSFEINHIKRHCNQECQDILIVDNRMNEFAAGYAKCMKSL